MTSDTIEDVVAGTYLLVSTRGWRRSGRQLVRGRDANSQVREIVLIESRFDQWVPYDLGSEWVQRTGNTGRAIVVHRDEEFPIDLVNSIDSLGSYPTEKRALHGDYSAVVDNRVPRPRPGGWGYPNAAYSAGLPRDPSALMQRFLGEHPEASREGVIRPLMQVMKTCCQPVWMRDALIAGAAQLHGVSRIPSVVDLDGVERIGIRSSESTGLHTILLDKDCGQYAGYTHHKVTANEKELKNSANLSESVLSSLITDVRIVDSIPGSVFE